MRATVLLSISALAACGKGETVQLTGKLVMSSLPSDWCGAMNPDAIRLDCPFDLGIYVTEETQKKTLKTLCVRLPADPNRKWANLPQALNQAMAGIDRIPEGPTVRFELAGVEPPADGTCDHDAAVAAASFYGKSAPVTLMGTDLARRIDISTRCLTPFTPTATCIP